VVLIVISSIIGILFEDVYSQEVPEYTAQGAKKVKRQNFFIQWFCLSYSFFAS